MDNVRGVGDTLAVAIEKSVTTRPYTTLALAIALGFFFGGLRAVKLGELACRRTAARFEDESSDGS